jgi:hypothetical protein
MGTGIPAAASEQARIGSQENTRHVMVPGQWSLTVTVIALPRASQGPAGRARECTRAMQPRIAVIGSLPRPRANAEPGQDAADGVRGHVGRSSV